MSDFSQDRLIGLDIARALAIIAVLLSHTRYLMDSPGQYLFLSLSGKIGVELFFVLSGFLIGAILIRFCEQDLKLRALFRFWIRRWFRTIPAYFAVLIFVWAVFGKVDFLYFLFLQELVAGNWDILPVSWSLVIEEWFYLLFAPTCFVLVYFSRRRGFLIASLLLVVMSGFLQYEDYGACAVAENPLKCFETDIRKFTFRFSSLGLGVLLAYVHHHRDLKSWLAPYLKQMTLVTVIVTGAMFLVCGDTILNFPGILPLPLAFALFYPLIGLASLFLVATLYVAEPRLPGWASSGVMYISVTSYSCYLWHLILNEQLRVWLTDWNQYVAVTIFLVGALVVAGVSYYLVERPFMMLRNRISP